MPRAQVLVVDDCPEDAAVMAAILHRGASNLDVSICSNGEEALAWLSRRVPDLVLLDLRLPGVDGHDVLRHVKQDARLRHVPVVVVTGGAAPRDLESCLRDGADGFVTKPLSLEQFTAAILAAARPWLLPAAADGGAPDPPGFGGSDSSSDQRGQARPSGGGEERVAAEPHAAHQRGGSAKRSSAGTGRRGSARNSQSSAATSNHGFSGSIPRGR